MHRLQNQKLPKIFTKSFTKLDAVHSHNTNRNNHVIFLPKVNKKISQNLLAFRGAKLWAGIKQTLIKQT